MIWVATALAGNVLIVVADDVGTDMVAAYGEHPETPKTPTIDALAARGVLFRNAWAHPWCSPTRAAIQTGRYADRFGFGRFLAPQEKHELDPNTPILPDIVPGDWGKAAVGKWHLTTPGRTGPIHPNLMGWPHHAGNLTNPDKAFATDKVRKKWRKKAGIKQKRFDYFWWEKSTNGQLAASTTYMTTDTTDDAIAQVDALPEPWLLYVAYNASHSPFHAPPAALHDRKLDARSSPRQRYLAMVEALDTELARLFAVVPDDTTIVFIGDNGTPMSAIGAPWDHTHGKGTMFEGGVNVPLIVAGPGVAAGESAALAHAVDILPTVAELSGQPVPDDVDGVSLLPWMTDPAAASREVIYTSQFRPNGDGPYTHREQAVRDNRYKLLRRRSGDLFFDLQDRDDDGPNLLPDLTEEQKVAYERLSAALETFN